MTTWYHVTTRIMGLLEIYQANYVYPNFPVGGGLPLDTIVIGKKGVLERFVDQDQLSALEKAIKKENFVPLLKEYQEYEHSILPIFEKDPFENRAEFMK